MSASAYDRPLEELIGDYYQAQVKTDEAINTWREGLKIQMKLDLIELTVTTKLKDVVVNVAPPNDGAIVEVILIAKCKDSSGLEILVRDERLIAVIVNPEGKVIWSKMISGTGPQRITVGI